MPNRTKTPELLRPVLLTSAAMIIVAGIGVALILGETTIGLIIAAVGVFDLLTMRFVVRTIERGRSASASPAAASSEPAATEAPPADPDPSYNPYARED